MGWDAFSVNEFFEPFSAWEIDLNFQIYFYAIFPVLVHGFKITVDFKKT